MSPEIMAIHRIHFDGYIDRLAISMGNKESFDEQIEYLNVQIYFEEKRLNRYIIELKPELYTDHEIIIKESTQLISTLKGIKKDMDSLKYSAPIYTFKWLLDMNKISLLFDKLKIEYITDSTELVVFESLFSKVDIKSVKGKIDWQIQGKNGKPNKKSILDFIDLLEENKVISIEHFKLNKDYLEVLDNLFCCKGKSLKFENNNKPKKDSKSEFHYDLKGIIQSIK